MSLRSNLGSAKQIAARKLTREKTAGNFVPAFRKSRGKHNEKKVKEKINKKREEKILAGALR
jgi:hypothetical protein